MKKVIFPLFLISYSLCASAQELKKIEQDLLSHLKKINYWAGYSAKGSDKINFVDSLQKENDILEQKILEYTRQPSTLTYPFNNLPKNLITIASSPDKKLRIYSWDTQSGGTMHFFKNVYQFQSGNKVFSRVRKTEEGDSGGWFSEVFALNSNDKTIYLGYFNAIYSSRDAYQGIKTFNIINNDINDTLRVIKTKSGLNNELGFGFDFFSVADHKERPVKLIYFDGAQNTIKIPVVTAKNQVTKNFIVYRFTGRYFERK